MGARAARRRALRLRRALLGVPVLDRGRAARLRRLGPPGRRRGPRAQAPGRPHPQRPAPGPARAAPGSAATWRATSTSTSGSTPRRAGSAARQVAVDSSKHASLAYCLRWSRRLDLRVLHVVRDSPPRSPTPGPSEVTRPESAGARGGPPGTTSCRATACSRSSSAGPSTTLMFVLLRRLGVAVTAGPLRGPGRRPRGHPAAAAPQPPACPPAPGARCRRPAAALAGPHRRRQPDALQDRRAAAAPRRRVARAATRPPGAARSRPSPPRCAGASATRPAGPPAPPTRRAPHDPRPHAAAAGRRRRRPDPVPAGAAAHHPRRDRAPRTTRAGSAWSSSSTRASPTPSLAVDDDAAPGRGHLQRPHPRASPAAATPASTPASGTYVAFCDDDDVWHPGKISAQVAALQAAPGAVLATCGIRILLRGHHGRPAAEQDRVTLADLLRSRLTELHPSTFLLRARPRWSAEVGLVDEEIPGSYAEDYEFLLRIARVHPVVNVRDVARRRAAGTSVSYFASRWDTIATALTWLLERYPEFDGEPRRQGPRPRPDRLRPGRQGRPPGRRPQRRADRPAQPAGGARLPRDGGRQPGGRARPGARDAAQARPRHLSGRTAQRIVAPHAVAEAASVRL